jgi:GntR family transcriptional regulator
MQIDHGAPEYLWRQLAALLRARIASGELPPGSRIPSLVDLAAEYDLSVVTVRKAVAALVAEGTLMPKSGRGTFVRPEYEP